MKKISISILIPCHNEEKSIRRCIEACLNQTRKADQIVVVDDGSTDKSLEILKKFGNAITVVRIEKNTGNKSYAQQFGLEFITGDVFIATDGDTVLDENFVQYIEADFEDGTVVAVGGYVKSVKHNWLTACRELDYILGQDIYKVAQSYINSLFVIPGCAGAFRTSVFKECISFDHDTVTEDLDFTYKLNKGNFKIFYDRNAIAYTEDPTDISSYLRQMSRWYSGGWQNLKKHIGVVRRPATALELSLIYIEGFAFALLLYILPLINFRFFIAVIIPLFAFAFILGTYGAIRRKRIDLLLYSPFYIVILYLNSYVFIKEFVKEIVLGRKNLVWHKVDRKGIV